MSFLFPKKCSHQVLYTNCVSKYTIVSFEKPHRKRRLRIEFAKENGLIWESKSPCFQIPGEAMSCGKIVLIILGVSAFGAIVGGIVFFIWRKWDKDHGIGQPADDTAAKDTDAVFL